MGEPEGAPRAAFIGELDADPARRKVVVTGIARPDGSGLELVVAHRVADADGRSIGYVLGFVELRYFERLYARVRTIAALS